MAEELKPCSYEARFIKIGDDHANQICELHSIKNSDWFREQCRRYKWLWFIAEMSDDYSRTLQEQEALHLEFVRYICLLRYYRTINHYG